VHGFTLEILTSYDKSIRALIKVNSDSSLFVLTVVYASPQFNKRKYMWQYLEDFVATTNRPLVLLGDFNDMLSEDKKLGGLLINPTRISF